MPEHTALIVDSRRVMKQTLDLFLSKSRVHEECKERAFKMKSTTYYFTICTIDSKGDFALCLRKLKQGLCINLEGWSGEGDGMEVQKGGEYI